MMELLTRKFFAKDEEGREREVEVWSRVLLRDDASGVVPILNTLRLADTEELLRRSSQGVYSSEEGELFLCYDSDAP